MPAPRNGSSPNARELEGKWRSRPISRVLSWTVIPLGASSPIRSSNLPGDTAGRGIASLFGLAPGGVCRAGLLPGSRCALTAPFHPCLIPATPLPTPESTWSAAPTSPEPGHVGQWRQRGDRAIGGIFLLHFPSARAAQALPGTVPCGARTFLGILSNDATVWPTPPRSFYGFRRQMTPSLKKQTLGPAQLPPIPCRCRGAPLPRGAVAHRSPLEFEATPSRTVPCAGRRRARQRAWRRSREAGGP